MFSLAAKTLDYALLRILGFLCYLLNGKVIEDGRNKLPGNFLLWSVILHTRCQ